ncbi:hypothetical protein N0V93_006100 [Gnomoniopsis smithogilvyi]|uniref:alpha-amylase n=1 Tax=Gnomoniopsis smithogilvyi TaxID=1191159 RepID=A0A9W9CV97_9PEZI|nr:hypothetical protein N0V93_006100 [Gnomoniopsis smithogilvyi]
MAGSGWLLSFLCLAIACQALSTAEWQKQSIYSVMTDRFAKSSWDILSAPCSLRSYCGGTWQGLIEHLDYIQGMGFTAVWISPVVKNTKAGTAEGDPYHGYWTEDLWSLNGHFGSEDDLMELSEELHSRGMYLMVDVVVNHMGPAGTSLNYTNYKTFKPFDSPKYYHKPCLIDDANSTSVVYCRVHDDYVSLPDLRTEDTYIRDAFQTWIQDLVYTYGIDGIRIDTVKHVEKSFFPDFIQASGVFGLAEIFDGDPASYPDWSSYVPGAFNYPVYYWMLRVFQSKTEWMDELVTGLNKMKNVSLVFGNFLENHDTDRFAHLSGDMALTRNALAFMMMLNGMPVINQGQEQHYSGANDPYNREPIWTSDYNTDSELYQWITRLNLFRSFAITEDDTYSSSKAGVIFNNTHAIGMKKANVVTVATNVGLGGSKTNITLTQKTTGYSPSDYYVDVLSCDLYRTTSNGSLNIELGSEPKIFYPAKAIRAAGWECEKKAKQPTCLVEFSTETDTYFGEMVMISGNVPQLGSWSAASTVALDASSYPTWAQTIEIPPGTKLEYMFLKDNAGNITLENGGAIHKYTVPRTCGDGKVKVPSVWETPSNKTTTTSNAEGLGVGITITLDLVS